MKTFELAGTARKELGKKAAKALRQSEAIPCVLYAGGLENVNFTVTENNVRKLIYTPNIYQVKLTIDGKNYDAVLKEIQFHPVTDKILHIDFLAVDDKKPIVFAVPIRTEGLAAGVKAGGKLKVELRKLKVKGLCKDIPEVLVINVEELELGKAIKAGDLKFNNIEIVTNKNNVVASVLATRASRGADNK